MKLQFTKISLFVLSLCLFGTTLSFGAENNDEPTAENEEAKEESAVPEEKSPLEISGFIDTYYRYSNVKESLTSFADGNNSFSLGMANIVFSKQVGNVGFVADLAVGPRAIQANGQAIETDDGTIVDNNLSIIKQLYVTWAATEKLTFTMGNFSTHVGYELIDANGNYNYSTSYLFSNGPFYHTGVKADYAFSDKFAVMAGIFNETDTKFASINPKYFGGQIFFAPVEGWDVYLNYIGGSADGDLVFTQEFDITTTYTVNDDFLIGFNGAIAPTTIKDEAGDITDQFSGAAMYLNYSLSEKFGLGFRGEYFATSVKQENFDGSTKINATALTLSGNYNIGPLRLIPEIRYDVLSDNIDDMDVQFTNLDGTMQNSGFQAMLAAVFSF
ncbi:porin [Persicobacter psychrovividus]|uniref:Porin n=1 Tax=Persicobacter psychrovividus TaxID=387638 RepID=A0ABN6LER7_9BACT|nr:hypothetical protein PEPS_39410 [Persicobacter psychrovividus]